MLEKDVALLNGETAWINLAQTAQLLGLDRSTLSKHAHAGHVHCVKQGLGRGQLVVTPGEVLRLADLYRRIPMKVVQKNLAHKMAVVTSLSEEVVIRALEDLHVSGTKALVQPRQLEAKVITTVLPTKVGRTEEQSMAAIVDSTAMIPVINLGRLHPRRLHEDDVPSADLLQAIDLRRPQPPRMQIVDSDPTVIDLGRLQPGRRL